MSHRTRIKFCGITRPADAVAAAHAGADAIGLIFYEKSTRCVSVDRAREILAALPPMVGAVGLFVNATPARVIDIANTLRLGTVQLHGDEPPTDLLLLPGLTVIKAVHCTAANLASIIQWHGVAGILLESASSTQSGGSGVANDWSLVESALFSGAKSNLPPLIAAGGLTPENVSQVVKRIRPWAVDVSTGIEASPGIKSVNKMKRFVAAVQYADDQRVG